MGLLNHLFSSKTSIAQELLEDKEKRWRLWQAHLKDHPDVESLVKNFSYGNIDAVLSDWPRVIGILNQMENLTRKEIIEVEDEERLDTEILGDIRRLKSTQGILNLSDIVIHEKHKQKALLAIFEELHHTLKARLHLINLIIKRPQNVRGLLLQLFTLVFHNESMLHKVFRENYTKDIALQEEIRTVAKAVIMGEKLKEEVLSEEELFAEEMFKKMTSDSYGHYKKVAERIWTELMIYCGAPVPKEDDIEPFIQKLEATIRDSEWMEKTVKDLHPRYPDIKRHAVVLAFQKAFNLGHFDDWQEEFFSSP